MGGLKKNEKSVQPVVREVEDGELLARRAAELTLEKKCEDVKILDLRELTSVTDFFVIVTADSERKARAVADHVIAELRDEDERPLHVEGLGLHALDSLGLCECCCSYIHCLEERGFYDLESLWSDAPVVTVT